MMIYNKKTLLPSYSTSKFELEDFLGQNNKRADNLVGYRYCSLLENFDCNKGILKDSFGLQFAFEVVGKKILSLHFYRYFDHTENLRKDMLIAYCEDGNFYQFLNGVLVGQIANLHFDYAPNSVNYRLNGEDSIVLTSVGDDLTVYNPAEGVIVSADAPKINSMAVHYERLFVTIDGEKNAVWFSDDLDITNWNVSLNEAGFVEMHDELGSLLLVKKFIDSIYVFKSYGIARLSAYAEQTEFSLINLFTTNAKIVPESVCVCGNCIVFVAENGIFSFDGVSTSKILSNLDGALKLDFAKGYYFDGKYFCIVKNNDDQKRVLVFDVNTGYNCLLDLGDISCLCPYFGEAEQKLFAVLSNGKAYLFCEGGKIDSNVLTKKYKSGLIDFSKPERQKHIKRFYISTKQDIVVTISSEKEEEQIVVDGQEGIQMCECNVFGREFCFEITSTSEGNEISKICFVFDTIGRA